MENLTFKVSSGLKNILGRELITDKLIAIFELVKNSYDAGASRVDITLNNMYTSKASIEISDNGCGMSKEDFKEKWLHVAASEKKYNRQLNNLGSLERSRTYAGAKGIGRFSCDRLGSILKIYSKTSIDGKANLLSIDWNDFEENDNNEFIKIPVMYEEIKALPKRLTKGTIVLIEKLREHWTRNDMLALKKALVKLVNPHHVQDDIFNIYLHCSDEMDTDLIQSEERDKVNGIIINYVFEALGLKTTQIKVKISKDGRTITTVMHDRGTFLFELVQESNFSNLRNIEFELFYLNRSAKFNFNKLMGARAVDFGSIFVYKNGFRIMPYGEPGTDWFNIDRRKAQGYNRYLSTRELMGSLVILGDNADFKESSSRDGGFIKSVAFNELESFYMNHVHRPLEKYVVHLIAWGDERDAGEKALTPEDVADEIVKFITNYERNGNIISLDVGELFIDLVKSNHKNNENSSLEKMKNIATKYKDNELDKLVENVATKTKRLKKDKNELEKLVDATEEKLEQTTAELETSKQQAIFLKGLTNPKFENATEALHLMNTYGKSIKINIDNIKNIISKYKNIELEAQVYDYIYDILYATQKIDSTYTFAFAADYDIRHIKKEVNLQSFTIQYIDNALFAKTGDFIKIKVISEEKNIMISITPIDFTMILENFVYNSFKAKAKNLIIEILEEEEFVVVSFVDDGIGLSKKISNANDVFELGFSTTNGTGVGLAQAKKVIESWGGTLEVVTPQSKGFALKMRLKK